MLNRINKKREKFYKMTECTFIIIGATGDLSKRMLLPAIYKLIADGKLEKFAIVGVALSESSSSEILERSKPFIKDIDETIWQRLLKHTVYQQLDVTNFEGFQTLKKVVEVIEQQFNLENRLVYCATAAHFFCDITENLGKSGILQRTKQAPWNRIVYEKPFGYNLASARKINECIARYVDENQVFRIDHYLTKELVANIALLRFTNIIFEPLWNNVHIDQVYITLSETLGLEGRGRYYDKYGVLKDVIQNHALQLLALTAMEPPQQLTGDYIRGRKAEILKKIIPDDGILGQYEGYHKEKDIGPDSQTATFTLLRLFVDTPRWQGVPFYIKAGKRLDKKLTSITIKFREIYCPLEEGQDCPCNYLIMQIAPHPSFSLELNIKPLGIAQNVHPVKMDFSYLNSFGPKTPAAYEILLEQIIQGEQAISVRSDEIEYAWDSIDRIEAMKLPLYIYKQKSNGPKEIETFLKKYQTRWRS